MTEYSGDSSADQGNNVPVIHVVDDDQSFLRAISRALRAAGFQVEEFESAEKFLLHRSRHPFVPGCVILDLQMPGLNGLELQELLSEQEEPLPAIFLSGHGDIPSSVRAMKRDAIDFLVKPVRSGDLVAVVNRAFESDAEARKERRQLRELRARYAGLTPREREVLALVVRGMLNKQIASALGTVERTIKAHRAQVMAKMQVQSLAELVRMAERLGDVL